MTFFLDEAAYRAYRDDDRAMRDRMEQVRSAAETRLATTDLGLAFAPVLTPLVNAGLERVGRAIGRHVEGMHADARELAAVMTRLRAGDEANATNIIGASAGAGGAERSQ